MYKDRKRDKQFFNLLNDCQVILLVSGIGSGKPILIPKFVKYIRNIKSIWENSCNKSKNNNCL